MYFNREYFRTPVTDFSNWLFYCRVSSSGQDEFGHGLDRYIAQAAELGILDGNLYQDVESGGVFERKGFTMLCNRLIAPDVEGVAIPYHSRLHRDVSTWVFFSNLLIEHHKGFIDLHKRGTVPIDLSSSSAEFDTGMDALYAQRQRREIQEHSIKGHLHRRDQARFSRAPFGYQLTKAQQLEPCMDEYRPRLSRWAAANQIRDWYLISEVSKGNKAAVCKKMIEEWGDRAVKSSSKTTGDRPGTPAGLNKWLNNPALRGHFYHSVKKRITVRDCHVALISPQQWAEIKAIARFPARPKGPSHRLADLLVCSECGSTLSRHVSHGGQYEKLFCRGAYPYPGTLAVCSARVRHKYSDVEAAIIYGLMGNAKRIADVSSQNPALQEDPQIETLKQEIKQLSLISGTDLVIKQKERELAALQGNENESEGIDSAQYKQVQALAAKASFWITDNDSARAKVYRFLLDTVLVSPSGAVSLKFRL